MERKHKNKIVNIKLNNKTVMEESHRGSRHWWPLSLSKFLPSPIPPKKPLNRSSNPITT